MRRSVLTSFGRRSALLHEHENGDLENKFVPISEEEADRIVAGIQG